MTSALRIIFYGSSDFSIPALEVLTTITQQILVVTHEDRPMGRGYEMTPSIVKQWAQAHHLDIIETSNAKDPALSARIASWNPDIGVVASFGFILPGSLVNLPQYGTLNIHPSLLPRHRGATPVQWTILSGDHNAGVTIMLMDDKMDHGPILAQHSHALHGTESVTELRSFLARLGAQLLESTIQPWIQRTLKTTIQDETKATFTKILTKEDGHIVWNRPATEIERRVRAFQPWPGTWGMLVAPSGQQYRFKIHRSQVDNDRNNDHGMPGSIILASQRLFVQCEPGLLELTHVQLEGKRAMDSVEIIRGYHALLTNAIVQ